MLFILVFVPSVFNSTLLNCEITKLFIQNKKKIIIKKKSRLFLLAQFLLRDFLSVFVSLRKKIYSTNCLAGKRNVWIFSHMHSVNIVWRLKDIFKWPRPRSLKSSSHKPKHSEPAYDQSIGSSSQFAISFHSTHNFRLILTIYWPSPFFEFDIK